MYELLKIKINLPVRIVATGGNHHQAKRRTVEDLPCLWRRKSDQESKLDSLLT